MSDGVPAAEQPAFTAAREHYDFYGGIVLAVIGAAVLAWSFMTSAPVMITVKISLVVYVLFSIAIAMKLIPVRNPQDFYGGMALIMLALVAFVASSSLPGQRGFAFGPGTAPRLFALTLALLSLGIAVMGLIQPGPAIERYRIRGVIFIIGAIVAFGASIRPLGLVFASFATVMICAAADPEVRWKETVIWAAILSAFCSILFPYGLNLPFQLWPRFWY